MMRRSLRPAGYVVAATIALNFAAFATIRHRPEHALRLFNGDDSQCMDYRIGSYASGEEIAAMLRDAAQGARVSGCVNLIIEQEG